MTNFQCSKCGTTYHAYDDMAPSKAGCPYGGNHQWHDMESNKKLIKFFGVVIAFGIAAVIYCYQQFSAVYVSVFLGISIASIITIAIISKLAYKKGLKIFLTILITIILLIVTIARCISS